MMKIRILETSDLHGFVLPTIFNRKRLDLPFSIAKARTKMDELTSSSEQKGEIVIKIEKWRHLARVCSGLLSGKKSKGRHQRFSQCHNFFGYDVGLLGNHEVY